MICVMHVRICVAKANIVSAPHNHIEGSAEYPVTSAYIG
jgi:hypothetical protein